MDSRSKFMARILPFSEQTADRNDVSVMQHIPGIQDIGIQRDTGQPNLDFTIDRQPRPRALAST